MCSFSSISFSSITITSFTSVILKFVTNLRGYLPIFSRILLEKVGGTYLSLSNKNSDLNFLENFTRKVGRGYLPIFSRILLEKVGGTYL